MGKKPLILIVDDEWAIHELIRIQFSKDRFRVSSATNGIECRELIRKEKPDLLMLDIVLGEEDGTSLYTDLVMEGLDSKIPVIFMSSLAQDRPPAPLSKERKFALIGKPFDVRALTQQISDLLQPDSR